MTGIALIRVHEPSAVAEIIDQAIAIASEQSSDPVAWRAIFEKSCDLLGARIPVAQQPASLGIDLNGFRA